MAEKNKKESSDEISALIELIFNKRANGQSPRAAAPVPPPRPTWEDLGPAYEAYRRAAQRSGARTSTRPQDPLRSQARVESVSAPRPAMPAQPPRPQPRLSHVESPQSPLEALGMLIALGLVYFTALAGVFQLLCRILTGGW